MTVIRDGEIVRLVGLCRVEDAEPLTALLQGGSDSTLDLSACEGLHAAVLQAILAFRPTIVGIPDDAFLRERLLPAMVGERQT
ncbi:hypothetical protein [Caulobacter sp.]|uniref:hypothetical protein n=1 Tax=Caulobacter sp. TaxID=78 RepID=UPI003BB1D0FC